MSEVKYRSLLRQLLARPPRDFRPEIILFANIMLESELKFIDQARHILAMGDQTLGYYVLTVIQWIRIDEFAPEIIHMFRQSEDPALKFQLMIALNYLQHRVIFPFLMKTVQTSDNISDRRLAAQGIKNKKLPSDIIPALVSLACDVKEPPDVRSIIIEALLDNTLLPVTTLLPLLQDHDGEVRWVALCGLEHLGDISLRSYVEPLVDQMWMVREREMISTRAKLVLARWEAKARDDTGRI